MNAAAAAVSRDRGRKKNERNRGVSLAVDLREIERGRRGNRNSLVAVWFLRMEKENQRE